MNALNSEGDSVLHSIVRRQFKHHREKEQKQEYLMALLMYSDADVDLLNAQKTTALHIAVEVGRSVYHMHHVTTVSYYSCELSAQFNVFSVYSLHFHLEYIHDKICRTHYLSSSKGVCNLVSETSKGWIGWPVWLRIFIIMSPTVS